MPVFFRKIHLFLYLETYKTSFEINCAPGVLFVFQNMGNSFLFPSIWIYRSFIGCFLSNTIIVLCWCYDFLAFKTFRNLQWTKTGDAKFKNIFYGFCSLIVDNPLLIPDKNEDASFINFAELSADFPELVNGKGEGWYYRHIQNIIKFVKKNPTAISEKAKTTVAGISKGFKTEWKKKVRQLQVPIFALNTKAAWALRLDDILADALELGALRTEEYILSHEKYVALQNLDLNGVPLEVICEVVAFYEANKNEDSDWVVLPIANFDCYYGNTNFSKKWLSKIPDTILTREVSNGICRVKVNI